MIVENSHFTRNKLYYFRLNLKKESENKKNNCIKNHKLDSSCIGTMIFQSSFSSNCHTEETLNMVVSLTEQFNVEQLIELEISNDDYHWNIDFQDAVVYELENLKFFSKNNIIIVFPMFKLNGKIVRKS